MSIPDSPSRSVVAISEDRQWLVVQEDNGWLIYKGKITSYVLHEDGGDDTGQDADEVLAAWLEGRNDRR